MKGAHQAFLEEIVDVADNVFHFTKESTARRPGALLEALLP